MVSYKEKFHIKMEDGMEFKSGIMKMATWKLKFLLKMKNKMEFK